MLTLWQQRSYFLAQRSHAGYKQVYQRHMAATPSTSDQYARKLVSDTEVPRIAISMVYLGFALPMGPQIQLASNAKA